MSLKVYLAGPIKGQKDLNFPAFYKWAEELKSQGYEVYNPVENGKELQLRETPEIQENLEFRRKVFLLDTRWICMEADAIALMPGWETSYGCQAEWALARAIGIQIIYL